MTTVQRGTLMGAVYAEAGAGTVRMEDVFDTDVDDLWAAVTQPERLARWVGTVEGDLRPGGRFTAAFTSRWEGPGRVEVCEAPHHLLVTLEQGSSDETRVEAWLTADGERTRLVVEERGLPLDRAPDHGAGWQVHVEDLGAYLEGRATSTWHDRWVELQSDYRPAGA
ncbi:MAG: SRPBCC family protein [Lapillicoccus sp.]